MSDDAIEKIIETIIIIDKKDPLYVKEAKIQARKLAARLIRQHIDKIEVNYLSDLSRAVGMLEGLGHPDPYLVNQREKMLKELREPME